ncbi:MAG: dNTP triphosphohydrolase [Rhodospirillales bacterium]
MAAKTRKPKPNKKTSHLYLGSDFARESAESIRENLGAEPYRSGPRRDYARLIHSAAFRRLQGKTQLFPGWESDFFRNRLTHSLEVSQVAESLAHRLNHFNPFFCGSNAIDPDITRLAGLAHDLGHPPFGHNGEKALDDVMKQRDGGFEGNAQTLRILARLEKKRISDPAHSVLSHSGRDNRQGLNLTYRSLASVLKYDEEILKKRGKNSKLSKGYYSSEKELVKKIKQHVAPNYKGRFKTIECYIMDLADDISYSTYDLEDSFKAGFLDPFEILSSSDDLLNRVAKEASKRTSTNINGTDALSILMDIFMPVLDEPSESSHQTPQVDPGSILERAVHLSTKSSNVAKNGYLRTELTSDLISSFISGVEVEVNEEFPSMSRAFFNKETLKQVEVLKTFTYEATIMSPRLKVAEYRGYDIVEKIFNGLSGDGGHLLLPDDFQELYESFSSASLRRRVICDFVAGMTDRYAIEFYARLFGENPQSIFKPM